MSANLYEPDAPVWIVRVLPFESVKLTRAFLIPLPFAVSTRPPIDTSAAVGVCTLNCAQTELNKAIAELQRATGNSMKANNVQARLR